MSKKASENSPGDQDAIIRDAAAIPDFRDCLDFLVFPIEDGGDLVGGGLVFVGTVTRIASWYHLR